MHERNAYKNLLKNLKDIDVGVVGGWILTLILMKCVWMLTGVT
jgi:hypothetical protein